MSILTLDVEVVFPDNPLTIGRVAFNRCAGLHNIVIPNSVTSIGDHAFVDCSNLESIALSGRLTEIASGTFSNCSSLESIVIPSGTERIGDEAFDGCSNLQDVYYMGNREDWAKINIENNNESLLNAEIHFNNDDDNYNCKGHTITLNESISLNFYFNLPVELLNDNCSKVVFSKNGNVVSELNVSNALLSEKDGVYGYVFSCPLATKEMADVITAEIIDSDGITCYTNEYSVKQYCEELIEQNADDAELVALVKSLMNYGAAAQEYFGYNTDNLANESLSDSDKVINEIPDGILSEYSTTWGYEDGYSDDISYYGVTLDLLADLNMRLYFRLPSGSEIGDYTFTITDNADNAAILETGTGAYGPYARITGIYSVDIDAEYVVNIYREGEQIGWVKTSPFAYIKSSLAQDGIDGSLRRVLNAMYYYNKCADAYFN